MKIMKKKPEWEKEWNALLKKEHRFLKKQEEGSPSFINQKLEPLVPKGLQNTLELAFCKAFEIVFEKGTSVIEKTYSKEKAQNAYRANDFAASVKQDKHNRRAFAKQAGAASTKNLLVAGLEGIGLGALGLGVPDIPLFTAVILKSIYEIAVSFGYEYDAKEEKYLILKIIETSLEHGTDLRWDNGEIDRLMDRDVLVCRDLKEQTQKTAQMLSNELLYLKFLQGIPVAGVIGGLSDTLYLKKITDYASIKYHKRFLLQKRREY